MKNRIRTQKVRFSNSLFFPTAPPTVGRESRFTEGQVVGILKELKAGARSSSLSRKYGISETTLYNWRSKYAGLEVSDLAKLRQLEDENRRLDKIVADQARGVSGLSADPCWQCPLQVRDQALDV